MFAGIACASVAGAAAYAVAPLLPSKRASTPLKLPADDTISAEEQAAIDAGRLAPDSTRLQRRVSLAFAASPDCTGHAPRRCVVTGGCGLVGQRLVEMLVERGAEHVVSFDLAPKPVNAWDNGRIEYVRGNLCDADAVSRAIEGADCVWHIAALVGPYHPRELYKKVNYEGTLNVIAACREHGVRKLVMSSSPSTRFSGVDIDGQSEDDLPGIPQEEYQQIYAETKAMGELACRNANNDSSLLTVAVAPHQVYGPRDRLFLPAFLENAGSGRLRVFSARRTGCGLNRVSFTHVDNYCHGLLCAESALAVGSRANGRFYIVTDGETHPFQQGYAHFWEELDRACEAMGFDSLFAKTKVPDWLMIPVAHAIETASWLTGRKFQLNVFAIKMITIHRWFKIDSAKRDLGYAPIVRFEDGWADTAAWYRANWLPSFIESRSGKEKNI